MDGGGLRSGRDRLVAKHSNVALANWGRACFSPPLMEGPHIEQATLEDLPQLSDLLRDLFMHEGDFVPDKNRQLRGLRLILEQPNRGRIFVVRQNGMILGMINLLFTISTAEGGFVILLEDLIVKEDYRSHGLGGMLLDHAIAYARKKDFSRITLLTDRLNADAHRFYRKHGFFESKMMPMRYVLSDNSGTHAHRV